jgi:subtilisin-like proprotein convertase family protein
VLLERFGTRRFPRGGGYEHTLSALWQVEEELRAQSVPVPRVDCRAKSLARYMRGNIDFALLTYTKLKPMKPSKIIRAICSPFFVVIALASALNAGAGTFTFSNTNVIVINDSVNPPTIASPYPSTNEVRGLDGSVITKITVQLFGITHSFPDDIDIVLVGPRGENTVLMANTGGEVRTPVTNIDLTLDDGAASNLPLDSALVSGTFKPTSRLDPSTLKFPPPAPAQPDGTSLSNFLNTEPNGTWKLFVVDDSNPDSGVIAGGWSLTVTTDPVLLSIAKAGTNVVLSWPNTLAGYSLQATPSLSPSVWTNVPTTPVIVSGYYTVTNSLTNSHGLFRLAK